MRGLLVCLQFKGFPYLSCDFILYDVTDYKVPYSAMCYLASYMPGASEVLSPVCCFTINAVACVAIASIKAHVVALLSCVLFLTILYELIDQ